MKSYLFNYFIKFHSIIINYIVNKKIEPLKKRYPNSIIGLGVSITPDCKLGNHTVIHSNVHLSNAVIGDYTYVNSNLNNVTIGKFCSIGSYCSIGVGKHPSKKFVSTFPAFYSKNNLGCKISFVENNLFEEFDGIEIGNDVWIGTDSIILDGVKIGNGVIVGAGAVVTKSVDDYAIVGGIPAKLIRHRFSKEQIEYLNQIKWWDKDINWIKKHQNLFQDINNFIGYFKNKTILESAP